MEHCNTNCNITIKVLYLSTYTYMINVCTFTNMLIYCININFTKYKLQLRPTIQTHCNRVPKIMSLTQRDCVEVQLANRNPHPPATQVTEAQNSTSIRKNDALALVVALWILPLKQPDRANHQTCDIYANASEVRLPTSMYQCIPCWYGCESIQKRSSCHHACELSLPSSTALVAAE